MRSEVKVAVICGFILLLALVGYYAWSGPGGKNDRTGNGGSNSLVKADQPAGDAGTKVQPPVGSLIERSSYGQTSGVPVLAREPVSTEDLRGGEPGSTTRPTTLPGGVPDMPHANGTTQPRRVVATRSSEPVPPVATGPTTDYTVKQGDTIWSVAKQFKVSRAALASANNLSPDAHLKLKQVLKIPAAGTGVAVATRPGPATRPGNGVAATRPAGPTTTPATPTTYKVKPGDTLRGIAKAVYNDEGKWKQIYAANKAQIGANPNDISANMVLKIPH